MKEEKRKIEGNEEKQRNNCIEPGIHIAMLQLHDIAMCAPLSNEKTERQTQTDNRQTGKKKKKKTREEKKRKKRKK